MNRIIPFAFAIAALATPAEAAERRYSVTSFERIEVEGPFQVVLATGRAGSAHAVGDQQAIDRVSIEVQGRVLKVRQNRSSWGGYPGESGGGALQIKLSTHELTSAAVSGSGSIDIDKAKAMHFDVSVAGSGRIAIGKVQADTLVLGLVGSGKLAVAGTAKSLRATISGAGDLAGEGLLVDDANVKADTAGTIKLGVKRAITLNATGSGDVEIAGSPACTVKASGSGRIACGSD